MSVLMMILVPSIDEIQQLQAELAYLDTKLDVGKLQWAACGDKKEKCLRVDEREDTKSGTDAIAVFGGSLERMTFPRN